MRWLTALACVSLLSSLVAAELQPVGVKDDGYRGIWFTLGQKSKFGDKYSGGLGTYTANHVPMAIYAPEVRKTFFVYGGAKQGERYLLDMLAYYDHAQGVVPRPTVVHDKQGVDDPHDNPSLCLDDAGYLWVFVSGRAKSRPGFIYRSRQPYSIDALERVSQREITYPQPRWIEGQGFLHLFTKYTKGRELYWSTSPDGRTWTPDRKFAGMGGHYQTSHQRGGRVVTAFNMHPEGKVDKRTNLYFLQTDDLGRTWRNVRGDPVTVPLDDPQNPALVRDYAAEKRLVYIHDLDLDAAGRPVILYLTSASFPPGPEGDPRWWTIAHWTGETWEYAELTRANHNYSTGSLYLEEGQWRVIGPTEQGPQPLGSGGEVAVWSSRDEGQTWSKQRDVTRDSSWNHNYVRRPINAHPEFYAFWADGNPDQLSPSHLYFTNSSGDSVWQLPYTMPGEFAKPELVTRARPTTP
ncbi:MAG: BNR-4 repeat-containing protein [Planctomycetota bacterium]|nr:BNR-4 repeat-containing protein [Planctomycetota bacterium]